MNISKIEYLEKYQNIFCWDGGLRLVKSKTFISDFRYFFVNFRSLRLGLIVSNNQKIIIANALLK